MEIGDKVFKKSNKPFKSGKKTNTIKGFVINPYTNKRALVFEEDDSVVDEWICEKESDNGIGDL
jgi:hypothetical protein